MRRKSRKNNIAKIGITFIILLILLASIGASYAAWFDTIHIEGTVSTGEWGGSCIKIRKSVDKGCPICGFCEKYYMTIEVMNNGTTDLTNVNVTDTLGPKLTKKDVSASTGVVYWEANNKDFRWDIGDMAVDQTETLYICFTVDWCCNFVCSHIEGPAETCGSTHPIQRIEEDGDEITVYYRVEHLEKDYGYRAIKFEDAKYANGHKADLGEDGKVETDTFIINVSNGFDAVRVKLKTGGQCGGKYSYSNLIGEGDSTTDSQGFTITLVDITDLGGGINQYTITITSDDKDGGKCGTKAMSHVKFDFGARCTINVNQGATVTAKSLWCDLEATTDLLNMYYLRFNKNCPNYIYLKLYEFETDWAWDCCGSCCECE